MKVSRAIATVALIAAAVTGSFYPADAQRDRDGQQRWINVVNNSRVTIREFYMTDVDTRGWGDDRLGDKMIEPGDGLRIVPTRRQREREYCRFDMLVVFSNDARVERRGVNLCVTSELVCSNTSSCSAR